MLVLLSSGLGSWAIVPVPLINFCCRILTLADGNDTTCCFLEDYTQVLMLEMMVRNLNTQHTCCLLQLLLVVCLWACGLDDPGANLNVARSHTWCQSEELPLCSLSWTFADLVVVHGLPQGLIWKLCFLSCVHLLIAVSCNAPRYVFC